MKILLNFFQNVSISISGGSYENEKLHGSWIRADCSILHYSVGMEVVMKNKQLSAETIVRLIRLNGLNVSTGKAMIHAYAVRNTILWTLVLKHREAQKIIDLVTAENDIQQIA